jgi:multiple antibiotic resistance protein
VLLRLETSPDDGLPIIVGGPETLVQAGIWHVHLGGWSTVSASGRARPRSCTIAAMREFYGELVTPFFAFLAVMSPLANAPIFLGLTANLPPREQKTIAFRGVSTACVTVAVFTFGGATLLEMFGITIAAVRAFGGLVVARIGFEFITQSAASSHKPVGQTTSVGLGIAISPLAIPILAGPGTLATALGLAAGKGELGRIAVFGSFSVVALLNLVAFLAAERLVKRLGEELIGATTKIMGIVLGAIGAQMVIAGVIALAKG